MPELPEVESFRRALEREYLNKKILRVHFHRDNIRYPLSPAIKDILRPGSKITAFKRDGKQLVIETKHGAINVSLGMSGAFLPSDEQHPHKHEHVTIVFLGGDVLGFVDPRRFGFWKVRTQALAHLADPLSRPQLSELFDSKNFRTRSRAVKEVLMDQKLIGGVGNIYALEALHRAGIRPTRSCNRITVYEFSKLAQAIPVILGRSIDMGGSSVSTYRRLNGDSGIFQELHRVYDREGKKCLKKNCRGVIKRIKQGGRGSWYCPKCQK
jgi:formamidopyrimidine-DNA glycosylase